MLMLLGFRLRYGSIPVRTVVIDHYCVNLSRAAVLRLLENCLMTRDDTWNVRLHNALVFGRLSRHGFIWRHRDEIYVFCMKLEWTALVLRLFLVSVCIVEERMFESIFN